MARRSMDKMFAGATVAAQKSDEIARLRQELEELKAQSDGPSDFQEIPVDRIVALRLPEGMGQPRKYFDPVKMEQLQESIDKHGILEPILVRPTDDGFYETVSGERRWRCCRELGKSTILARIKPLNDEDALEVALIATIHSEGVSAIEETDSVLALIKLYLGIKGDQDNRQIKSLLEKAKNYRQTGYGDLPEEKVELVEATLNSFGFNLGSFVSNRLPLLDMATPILEAVRMGQLSPTNALLINRTPSQHHEILIGFGKSATKKVLIQKIAELKQSSTSVSNSVSYNSGIIDPSDLRAQLHARYQRIRKKAVWKRIEGDPQLKEKIEHVDLLLAELLQAAEVG